MPLHTYNVSFLKFGGGAEDPVWDETEIEIEEGSFQEMANDLFSIWNALCEESQFDFARIENITEVFDGDPEGNI